MKVCVTMWAPVTLMSHVALNAARVEREGLFSVLAPEEMSVRWDREEAGRWMDDACVATVRGAYRRC